MNLTLVVRAIALLVLLPAAAFSAPRAFVKSTGSDADPCSLAAPCRTFAAAITAVDAGGEVVALDSAGYGPFTVNKAVTVSAPLGVYAGATATGNWAHGVTVAAGASDVVVLRGLSLKSTGPTNASGIRFTSGAALHVESCVVSGFRYGIFVNFASELFIKDTVVQDSMEMGLWAETAQVLIEGSRFERHAITHLGYGVAAIEAKVTAHNSEASGWTFGFVVTANGKPSAELNLRGIVATNNYYGVFCDGGPGTKVRVADAVVTGNGTGFYQGHTCVFESLGNSLVRGNTKNTEGTITPVAGI